MEQSLLGLLGQDQKELLVSLKEGCTQQELRATLVAIWQVNGERFASNCVDTQWVTIVKNVYWGLRDFSDEMAGVLTDFREGVGHWMFSEVERLYREHPEMLSRTIERECVRRLISLLPEMVKRVEMLSVLGIWQKPPKHLVSYMTEAGRCFIYGQFLACLFLCRSVIETCTEDRLRERGFSEEVQAIRKDKLVSLLGLALLHGLMDEVLHAQADEIRRIVNRAVHSSELPDVQKCGEVYAMTRGIVEQLYS